MIKVFKSKIFVGAMCLVLAAVIAFGVLPWIYMSKNETTQAVKLAQDVKAGTVLTGEMLATWEVGAYGLPECVLRDSAGAVGMVAASDLYAGEYLTGTRLISEEEFTAQKEEQSKGLTAGLCLVTIQCPTVSSGVPSILRAGNIVDVFECVKTTDEDGTETEMAVKALPSMYVYDVLNSKLQSLTDLDERRANALADADTDYDFQPAYIVFRCSEFQAATMIRLERAKTLHLTLQRTGG